MSKDDLLALPAAVKSFNGFYTTTGQFTMMNSIRLLIAFAIGLVVVLVAIVWVVVRFIRRRLAARRLRGADPKLR